MNLNRLDLNLLVALDVLLTERSITRAAERLNLSPSATSGALGRLCTFFYDELLTPNRPAHGADAARRGAANQKAAYDAESRPRSQTRAR